MPVHAIPSTWSVIGIVLFLRTISLLHAANDGATKSFDLAADTAERSLKAFSEQSGRGVIFVTDAVKGVRTNRVRGDLTPIAALESLLRNSGLVASSDAKTGAFAVRRKAPEKAKNGQRAVPTTVGDRPRLQSRPILSMNSQNQ